jgi:hypothetical protein
LTAQMTVESGPWNLARAGYTPPPTLIVWVFVLFRLRGRAADFGIQVGDFDLGRGWELETDGGQRGGTPLLWAPMGDGKPPELPDKRWATELLLEHMRRHGRV